MRISLLPSFILALLLWVLSAFELVQLGIAWATGDLGTEPFVGPLLTEGTAVDRAIPTVVIAIFAWMVVQLGVQAAAVAREHVAVSALGDLRPGTHRRVQGTSRAARRSGLIAEHERSPSRLHAVLPDASALDAEALDNAYHLPHALVWALPVLGFIGTAWGMTHAIGGFAEALNQTSEIQLLADRLSQFVIPGLSGAFRITMLALTLSVIGYFCLTALQTWDAQALQALDARCAALLQRLPEGRGDAWELVRRLEGPLQALAAGMQSLAAEFQSFREAEQLSAAAGELRQGAAALAAASQTLDAAQRLPFNIRVTRGDGVPAWEHGQ